ncbi:tigger transposable element-derived protein 1-like [Latimeria chalumnae]|uniref:tigger transposable element-derived protein 1-like n=1 Tax=Latimeria chalumnae TaxID=7897 RepID=UPI00313E928A
MGLFWKRMPSRTYISREEKTAPGFKAAKDSLTLLFGSNTASDMKMKPLLVYHSKNPRALKGYSKDHLPIIWRHSKNGWVNGSIFSEWLTMYAIPAWRDYCAKENLDFKIILLIDNAPVHPPNLSNVCDNVKIIFLPPNTTSLTQPMDQGVIAAFKAYYLHRTFDQLIKATDGDDKPTIREFWRGYNILNCIDNISESWAEVTQQCMNGVWGKLWPESVNRGFTDVVPSVNKDILKLAMTAGFDELEEKDIEEVLESHTEELTNEDLQQLEVQRACIEEDDEDDDPKEQPQPQMLTTKRMAEAFHHIDIAMQIFSDDDPNRERSSKVSRGISDVLRCYSEIYQEKKKKSLQQTLAVFFCRKEEGEKPAEEEGKASASLEGAPEDPPSGSF